MPLYARMLLFSASPGDVEPAAAGHREQLIELRTAGRVRAAGELANGDGFLEIFQAADLHEAEALTRASPLVEGGLAAWTLREWVELQDD